MFAIAEGFDIVIGNPPYIRGEAIPDKARLVAAFAGFYKATADIYTYFFHKGADLLRRDGLLCYIVSNKFMRAAYGTPLRAFLKRQLPPLSILDFGRSGTFDATVRPLVLLARKGAANQALCAATVRGGAPTDGPAAFMADNGFDLAPADLPDSGWSLAEPALLQLRRKIEAAGTPLRDYLKGGIRWGTKTGLNDAFVIDAATRESLIAEHAASADLIRPWLRGRDVRRWRADWRGLYLIFTRRGTDIARYPAIERHLSRYRTDLEPKPRRGAGPGRKPGSYKWFEIQDDIAYHRAFARPKIVYPDIGTKMRALLDREGHLTGNTCYILPGADACLLALLNSRLLDLWFRLALPCLDDPFDGGDMRFIAVGMQHTPIAPPPPATAQRLATLAERIQTAKQSTPTTDTQPLEQEIDRTVFDLYGLNQDDIAVIERATGTRL